jgi:hypothetical protein
MRMILNRRAMLCCVLPDLTLMCDEELCDEGFTLRLIVLPPKGTSKRVNSPLSTRLPAKAGTPTDGHDGLRRIDE